ncbi:hypothetical protein N0V82_005922 [Gnomoniopsis sp. IMI 355080]|nr:hypothetical protein N0V82_005922 [Gnomoniopsis sp. IMI 355080]
MAPFTIAAGLTALLSTAAAATAPTVHLANNLTIHGRVSPLTTTVHEFLGIPYAAPPLGPLRWEPPQPYNAAATTVVNATALPPSCWQYISKHPGILRTDAPQFMIGDAGMSEDCLTMSVWAPASALDEDAAPLPVLIWFYGGGFATGGTDVPYQIPTRWIERSQEHIVVVFNYRLNIFGFPTAAGLPANTQNLGLLDQRFAVEWLRTHIGAFGGDADRMVIWGQSAGATAVDFYQYAYPDDPLVTGLIQDSGTAHLDILKNSAVGDYSSFSLVAANVGCANATSSPAAELECMRGVPAEKLEGFVATYEDGADDPALTFIPLVDGVLVFENYTERAAAGNMSNLPAIIGNVANEGMFLTTYNTTNPDFATALEYSYEYFWCPTAVTTLERLANNRTTHRWFYSGNFTNISPKYWDGAYHESELPMLFGTHMDFRGNSTEFEYELSYVMQDAYAAFVKDPEHGLDAIGWPAYQGLGGEVLRWGDMTNMTLAHLTTLTSIEEGCRSRGLL